MKELNLESNEITDFQIIDFFNSLVHNTTLTKLNLSKNFLTSTCCPALLSLLK